MGDRSRKTPGRPERFASDDNRREPVGLSLESCPHCGYALKGLPPSHACPECGTAFGAGWWSLPVWEEGGRPRMAFTAFCGVVCMFTLFGAIAMWREEPFHWGTIFPVTLCLLSGAYLYAGIRDFIRQSQGRTDRTFVATTKGYAVVNERGGTIAHGEWRKVEGFSVTAAPSGWLRLTIRHAHRSMIRGDGVSLTFQADEATADRVRACIQLRIERAREQAAAQMDTQESRRA